MPREVAEPIIKRTQVVVDPPKPVVEPPKVPLPETEAELKERRDNVLAAMWGPTKAKPAAAPVEEAPPETPPAADAEAPPAPAEGEQPAPTADAPPAPVAPAAAPAPSAAAPVDTNALIAETARKIGDEVGRAIEEAQPEAPQAREEAAGPELTPEDARDAEIIAKMEELDSSLKGRAEAFKSFAHRRYDYEADWRTKHPGQRFNPDDVEHEEFYKGQPEIDEDLYARAERKLEVAKEVAEVVKPIREKADADQRRTKSEQAISAHVPKIVENVKSRIIESVTAVNPEVAKMLGTMNPFNLTKDEQEKLDDEDPITARVMGPMVRSELIPMLVELEKSVAPGAEYALDPRTNPVHANIARFVEKFETDAARHGEKRDGRAFITIAELNGKQADIYASKADPTAKQRKLNELHARHWTASVDDIQKTIVEDISKRAKAAVEEFDGIARRKYKPEPKTTAAKPAATAPTAEQPPSPAANGKPRPPSVASQSTVADTSRAGKPADKSFGKTAVAVHWGE